MTLPIISIENASITEPGGAPVLATEEHGTEVAGVIAAARNGKGLVGVAHDAQLVSIYSSFSNSDTDITEIVNAFA
ncbi:MAG: S8 family serine peptidase [Proteobacteria bacterium]|nr:S8 family serine peptidase [Pseudomonadota bacterium]